MTITKFLEFNSRQAKYILHLKTIFSKVLWMKIFFSLVSIRQLCVLIFFQMSLKKIKQKKFCGLPQINFLLNILFFELILFEENSAINLLSFKTHSIFKNQSLTA